MANPTESYTSSLISLQEALDKLLATPAAITGTETIALTDAAGRITATPVISPINVPPFDNSAMDGYGLRLSDWDGKTPLPLAGRALAGVPFKGELPAGQCVRIMTGAPVPKGVDTVVLQEEAEVSELPLPPELPPGRISAVLVRISRNTVKFYRQAPNWPPPSCR